MLGQVASPRSSIATFKTKRRRFFMQWLVDLVGTKFYMSFREDCVSTQKRNPLGLPVWQTTSSWSSLNWKQLEVRRAWGEPSHVLDWLLLSFKDLLWATAEKGSSDNPEVGPWAKVWEEHPYWGICSPILQHQAAQITPGLGWLCDMWYWGDGSFVWMYDLNTINASAGSG